eukprot:176188-Prymnesium_polylepis.3
MVHCAGVCGADEESQCFRTPPGDELADCAERAARGDCRAELKEGNAFFLAQCFESCGQAEPQLLMDALLQQLGDEWPAGFPTGLADAAEEVGTSVDVEVGLQASPRTVRVERVHGSPRVRLLHGVLSDKEAQSLMRLGYSLLRPSGLTSAHAYGAASFTSLRTSSTADLVDTENPTLNRIRKRLARLSGYPVENIEPLQVRRWHRAPPNRELR